MKMQVALLCACATVGQAWAAPVFQLGVDNNLGFQSVGNKTGGSAIAVGDLFYGVINIQDISSNGTTTWNANNVAPPIDSFTGYFLAQVKSVTATPSSLGTFYSAQLGVASSDPNSFFSTADLTSGMMMKLYTDTTTAYTTGGPVAADIAHATDGKYWGGLGITHASSGYWTVAVSPSGVASASSFGGLDFINNNSGLSWTKVLDTNCGVSGGCAVDMKFVSTFSPLVAGGAWQISSTDPATLHPVPLPPAALLMSSGMLALAGLFLRRKNRTPRV